MRFVRFRRDTLSEPQWGCLKEEGIDPIEGSPFSTYCPTGESLSINEVKLLSPVAPGKIIGVGRNFPAHAQEHHAEVPKEPLLFFKPSSAVIGPNESIVLPPESSRVEHEAELAVVIGKKARRVNLKGARNVIGGFTAANDVTARDLQRRDAQWTRGKGFDTFCPLGPYLETELEVSKLAISCFVNGERRQSGMIHEMVFSIEQLIVYITAVMTLDPGDLILTGTPSGVGPLMAGDVVTVSVGPFELTNKVCQEVVRVD